MAGIKTVVIWDNMEGFLKFFVIEGRDISHLNGKYVNCVGVTDEESDEVSNLMYNKKGKRIIDTVKDFPVDAVREGAGVIICGFMP